MAVLLTQFEISLILKLSPYINYGGVKSYPTPLRLFCFRPFTETVTVNGVTFLKPVNSFDR